MARLGWVAPILACLCLSATAAQADKIKHPIAVFAGLDKITGRIFSFEVNIDETVEFGTLQITPRVCFSRPVTEAPHTDGFVEVGETDEKKAYRSIFSGWMFADSPGLHGVEDPVYDVWLTDCKGGTEVIKDKPQVAEAMAPPPALTPDPGEVDPNAQPTPTPTVVAKKKKVRKIPNVINAPAAPMDLSQQPQ